jgi:hypothetical protein
MHEPLTDPDLTLSRHHGSLSVGMITDLRTGGMPTSATLYERESQAAERCWRSTTSRAPTISSCWKGFLRLPSRRVWRAGRSGQGLPRQGKRVASRVIFVPQAD